MSKRRDRRRGLVPSVVTEDEMWDMVAEAGPVPDTPVTYDPRLCTMCRKPIHMMIFRGTGFCCQSCEEAPF